MNRLREQRGQAMVLACLFIVSVLGVAALVLDVGSWYRKQRDLQAVADASALAGAHALPTDTGRAAALAREYASKNGGYSLESISFSGRFSATDTISVKVSDDSPGFFAKIFDIDSAHITTFAAARAQGVDAAMYVAPIVVNENHPDLQCVVNQTTCVETKIQLVNLHKPGGPDAAGAFGLLDLAGGNGSVGDSELAEWMSRGLDKYMKKGEYNSVPSAKFNGSNFCEAVEDHARVGDTVFFPIYADPPGIISGGSNATYQIIGWVGFVITGVDCRGSKGWVSGYFTGGIVEGIQADSAGDPSFGVRAIELVE